METKNKKVHEPLFHIAKRAHISGGKAWLIRIGAVLAALIICAVVTMLLTGENPFSVYATMFEGAFGTERKIWKLLQNLAINWRDIRINYFPIVWHSPKPWHLENKTMK